MEYVDLVDENRVPLGRVHPRGKIVSPGEYCVVVGIWVFNRKGEILLTRRDPAKRYAPNLWENTGGHVRPGEASADAAMRELFEETGISARAEELVFLGCVRSAPYLADNYALYRDLDASLVRLQPGETCAAGWVTPARFDEMAAAGALSPFVAEQRGSLRAALDAASQTAPARLG